MPQIETCDRFDDERHGTITFQVPGESGERVEVLRFEPLGACYVRGEKVDDNMEIYRMLRHWLNHAVRIEGRG